jgi:hypothetical protein
MTKWLYTRSAEIELEVSPLRALALRFCDANVAQWSEPLGDVSDWDDGEWDALVRETEGLIESSAADLAETLVSDLRVRVLGSTEPHEHICAVVGDHAVCRCLCGATKPKGGAWPQPIEPQECGERAPLTMITCDLPVGHGSLHEHHEDGRVTAAWTPLIASGVLGQEPTEPEEDR